MFEPKSVFKSYSNISILVFAWLYVVFFYGSHIFTNESTPGGDAKRVIGYIESARESNYFLPLWDPYTAGGRPSLADPEWLFYRLLSPVFQLLPHSLYNLVFNLILLLLLCLLTACIYFFAIRLGIKRFYAGYIAALLPCSGFAWSLLESGRINALWVLTTNILCLLIYSRWRNTANPWLFLSMIFLLALNLAFAGHYILVGFFMLSAYVLGLNSRLQSSLRDALRVSIIHLSSLGILALSLAAIFLLPLFEVQLGSVISLKGWGVEYKSLSAAGLKTLFIPDFSIDRKLQPSPPFVSFTILLGVILMGARKVRELPAEFILMLTVALFYLLLAIGFAMPNEWFNRLYSGIPLINLIRWGNAYIGYAILMVGLLSAAGLSYSTESSTRVLKLAVLIVYLMMAMWLFYQVLASEKPVAMLNLITLALISFFIVCVATQKYFKFHFTARLKVLVIVGLGLHLAMPKQAFFTRGAMFETPRSTNVAHLPELAALLDDEKPVLRQYCPTLLFCPQPGKPNVPGITGFSMFFPAETRFALEYIMDRDLEASRPHWVGRAPCSKLNENGLEMANVRYLYCRGNQRPSSQRWLLRGTSGVDGKSQVSISLWENPQLSSPFKLFYRATSANTDYSRDDLRAFWSNEIIVLDGGHQHSASHETILPRLGGGPEATRLRDSIKLVHWDEERLRLEAIIESEAMLFISSIYQPGWSVTINGEASTLYRAYGAYQAISLPNGESRVLLEFRPRFWHTGKIISGLTLILLLAYAAFFKNREKRSIVQP
ncbi:MAG: YfhO family protein [Gammaproteobacteria bacterium]|nr:YfhO family protein [Gammaproteobacteria bacterium]